MQVSPELQTIIAEWFTAWDSASPSWVGHHLSRSDELLTIGTDSHEWFEGRAAFEYLRQEMNGTGGIKFSSGEIKAWQEGTVGWGIACPVLILSNGKQISLRWSAIFHKEENEWKMVQLHVSVGVPNEQLLG